VIKWKNLNTKNMKKNMGEKYLQFFKKWWFWSLFVVLLIIIIWAILNPAKFLILIFYALIIVIILGLIDPEFVMRWGKKRGRIQVVLIYGLLAIIIYVASGKVDSSKKLINRVDIIKTTPIKTTGEKERVVFNIPSLINKKTSQIISDIGKPSSEFKPSKKQLEFDPNFEHEINYKKGEYELQVFYYKDGTLVEIFLAKNTNSEAELLNAGNLKQGSNDYILEFQPVFNESSSGYKYTGVHVFNK
jgi:hypothetical protein